MAKAKALTPEQIQDLKNKHGTRLYSVHIEGEDEFIIFRPATDDEWDELLDNDSRATGTRVMLDACVVYPDAAQLKAIHERNGALGDRLAVEIKARSGGSVEVKKL